MLNSAFQTAASFVTAVCLLLCAKSNFVTSKLSVVKAGYSARYRICTGYAQLAQISKRCSTCIHVAAV